MKAKHRKILAAIFADPLNGNMKWSEREALLVALGCRVVERAGSSITCDRDGIRACFHRPRPEKQALRYRVKDAQNFLLKRGEAP